MLTEHSPIFQRLMKSSRFLFPPLSLTFFFLLSSCNIFNNSEPTPPSIVGGWKLIGMEDEAKIQEQDLHTFLVENNGFSTDEAAVFREEFLGSLPRPILGRVVYSSDLISYRSRMTAADDYQVGTMVLADSRLSMYENNGSKWYFDIRDLTRDNLNLSNTHSRIVDLHGNGQTHTVWIKTKYYLTRSGPLDE